MFMFYSIRLQYYGLVVTSGSTRSAAASTAPTSSNSTAPATFTASASTSSAASTEAIRWWYCVYFFNWSNLSPISNLEASTITIPFIYAASNSVSDTNVRILNIRLTFDSKGGSISESVSTLVPLQKKSINLLSWAENFNELVTVIGKKFKFLA